MLGARKSPTDLWEEFWRVSERLGARFGAELDLMGCRNKVFDNKGLQILHFQKSRKVGAALVIWPSFRRTSATKTYHEAALSNHTLSVLKDGNFDFNVLKSKDALISCLWQASRPTGLGGLPRNLPSLVT